MKKLDNTLISLQARRDVLNLMLTCSPMPVHEDEIAYECILIGGIVAMEVAIDTVRSNGTGGD